MQTFEIDIQFTFFLWHFRVHQVSEVPQAAMEFQAKRYLNRTFLGYYINFEIIL